MAELSIGIWTSKALTVKVFAIENGNVLVAVDRDDDPTWIDEQLFQDWLSSTRALRTE